MPASKKALEEALHQLSLGSFSMAEQYCWYVLSNSPNDAAALQLLGRIAARQNEFDRAIEYFNRSLICDGSNAETWRELTDAHANKGSALKAVGRLGEAADAFQSAVRLRPDDPSLLYQLAVTLHQLGDF